MNRATMPELHAIHDEQIVPKLRLCGDAELITGAAVMLGAKDLGLLAYLRLEPGPHSREKLTALLWGEYPEEKARGSLRQALRHLRDALGDAIEVDRTTVSLAADAVACDVAEFLAIAGRVLVSGDARTDITCIEAALAIDVPRFLSNVTVRNSPAFDDWATAMQTRLSRRYIRLLGIATHDALAQGAWREGCWLAERWSGMAPYDDEPIAALMEAEFLGGDATEALTTYADHATRLAAEVHRAPGQALIELAARIRRASLGSHQRHTSRRTTNGWREMPSFEGSLIGRRDEWDALTHSWDRVCDGATCVVLLEGEPGSGKTRLARDFLQWVATHGGTVLRAAGYNGHTGAPFGAVVEVLRSGLDAPGLAGVDPQSLAQVARLLPELRGKFPGLRDSSALDQPTENWRLFEAIAQVIVAIADEGPMAILIDDLQWCDADSCSLIQFLIRRTSGAPVLWCVTFTAGEVASDAAPARVRRALRGANGTVAITLQALTEQDLWRFIRELGHIESLTAGRRLAARLHALTGGNPFYVIELLKALFARRLLVVDSATGRWVVGSGDGEAATSALVAQSVQDAIAERVESLPEELQAILATIAVAGRGCAAAVLSHMHGISRLRAAALGDALVERHLVVEDNGQYRCAHPILADVIRSRLSTARRRETHRALALSLEFLLSSSSSGDGEMGDIARHAEQGNDRSMAYRYSLLAADVCSRRSAYEEALSWLHLAALCAETIDESQIAGRHAAALLEQAGWYEAPPSRAPNSPTASRVDFSDLDLPPG